jgi:PKD repeat protein
VTITKTADTTGPVGLNDIITYNITVCNTGNMTLEVQVFDNRTSTYTVTGLPKGQCNTTSRPYLVTGDDICNGSVINYAYAIGTDTCGNSTLTSPNATVTIPTRPSGNISGMKFNDLDGNGTRDINDNALPGWTINLYYASNGTFITSVVTNATGEYLFQDLPCGIYRVNETQNASWNQTAPAGGNYTVEINGTSLIVTGRDFGNQQRIIKCACPTRAYYTYAQVGSLADHRINFTDKSTGYPVEWNWSFGDGTYSNLKNPQHQYASPGYYKVTEYVKVCGCTGQVYWTSYTRTSVRVR